MAITLDFSKLLIKYNTKHKTFVGYSVELWSIALVVSEPVTATTINNSIVRYRLRPTGIKNTMGYSRFLKTKVAKINETKLTKLILSEIAETNKLSLEVWPSTKIKYAYLGKNYCSSGGDLNNSCMRYSDMQKSLNFYEKQGVQIIVLVNNKKQIYARALLWINVKNKNKTYTYMDRIYSVSSKYHKQFYDLAEENKWKTYGHTSANMGSGDWYIDNVNLEGITHTPYTDTFRHLYYKDKIITSGFEPLNLKHKNFVITFTTTNANGYRRELDPNSTQEVFTGVFISTKDGIFIKRYDGYVLKSNIVKIDNILYSKHDELLVKSDIDGYIFKENSVIEVITELIVDKNNCIKTSNYKGYIHKKNAVKINSVFYHKNDPEIIRYEKKWFHSSQCFVNYDRKKINGIITKRTKKDEGLQRHIFSDNEATNNFMEDIMLMIYTLPVPQVYKIDTMIPKKYTTIAYDLVYSQALDKLLYQEVYLTKIPNTIKLVTGELIMNTSSNRVFLKKFNNKYYLKSQFKKPDKNQMIFDFMKRRR